MSSTYLSAFFHSRDIIKKRPYVSPLSIAIDANAVGGRHPATTQASSTNDTTLGSTTHVN